MLFRRELDLQQRFFAMGEAIAHLNHLWQRGRARAQRRRPTARSASPRKMAALPSRPSTRNADVHARRPLQRPHPPPGPTYDPVALAESLAAAAEKSAKLMGDFAARNAGKHALVASDELGLGKAFMELAAKMLANPGAARRGADEPVVGLHEPVAVVDAAS